MDFTLGISPKATKNLGPEPPKAEKPGSIPKIRKVAQTVRIFLGNTARLFSYEALFPAKAEELREVTGDTGRKRHKQQFCITGG